ncbi:MgtC/SapB family protein, partial [Bacillus toyonensis]|nr:MgtC/SapB family protein [Bacillus toyonensis]
MYEQFLHIFYIKLLYQKTFLSIINVLFLYDIIQGGTYMDYTDLLLKLGLSTILGFAIGL